MNRNFTSNIVEKLARFGVLQALTKQEAEDKFIDEFKLENRLETMDKEKKREFLKGELKLKDDDQLSIWREKTLLTEDEKFFEHARLRFKRGLVINELLKTSGESLFLRYKDRLDRVLYSLIRVESEDQSNELYYSLDSREYEFGDIAERFSSGPESKTRGIVGPVDLTTPHPEVAARLRTATPGKIIGPFKASDWFAIIRLEYRFESEYDEKTKAFLGSLILGSKSKSISDELFDLYIGKEQA